MALFVFNSPRVFGMHILLDPGHGGNDRGAVRGHLRESEITLEVAKKLERLLKQDTQFQVSLTRSEDRFVSLSERTEISDQSNADLFLSIHVNASPDVRARGAEFYFQNQLPPDEDSLFLASLEMEGHGHETGTKDKPHEENPRGVALTDLKSDVANIVRDLHRNSKIFLSSQLAENLMLNWAGTKKSRRHVIRQAPFYVVSHVNVPSALVEIGFLSHKREGQQLADSAYQDKLADSIYRGLVNFKEFVDK